jgi:uncharacterized protein YjbI with pentapeptide repeats
MSTKLQLGLIICLFIVAGCSQDESDDLTNPSLTNPSTNNPTSLDLSGNWIGTIQGVGTSTITATQASTANYTSGTIVTTLTINSYENANLTGFDLSGTNLTGQNLSNSILVDVLSSVSNSPSVPSLP